ncbi:MAG: DUF1428 domain-containing protein [Rhodovulum sulfidophilum]|uniref:DUF1428 domain-containing protein n=1 Tax=Rhodovulum sulfidophilum TaxID=35806 RepID=A0A2W5NJ96_RHOSU|nr:MAG: DUF1428 domain-containing protein [Rhodovulum sulfidophilum]
MSYVEGFVVAVPAANKELYRAHAAKAAPIFHDLGATRLVEAWGDDVPDGKLTDFKGAVKAEPDEVVVFSWLEYPSKEARDTANDKMMNDPEVGARFGEMSEMPFDGKRMIFAGFEPILDERGAGATGYVDGYLVPVPKARKGEYRDLAARVAEKFKEYGASRVVEAWADEVPDGKVTDYKGAVKATGDEGIVFSWVEWPSKEIRDAAWKRFMAEPGPMDMPFDGKRMIYGGFAPIVDA